MFNVFLFLKLYKKITYYKDLKMKWFCENNKKILSLNTENNLEKEVKKTILFQI
jgi:hypothetical protein